MTSSVRLGVGDSGYQAIYSSQTADDLRRTEGDHSFTMDDNDERKRLIQWEDGLEGDEMGAGRDRERPPADGRKNVFTYEEAVTSTGYGRFHVLLLLLCGWAVSSDAVEVLSVSFLLPSASCELKMTSSHKGWLSAIVFVGMMVGGYFWGSLADKGGRRSILLWSLMVNGIGGLLSSVSQVFWLFLLMRFISGIGVGGSMPVIFSYFCEFQPKDRRGSMISVLATFWMGGNILAAGLAWIIIPQETWGYFSPEFTFSSWRIFIAVCTIPALSSAVLFFLMPESPKYLLTVGREMDAIYVLKQVHERNRERQPFKVEALVLSDEDRHSHESSPDDHKKLQSMKAKCAHLLDSTVELFRPPLLGRNVVLLVINFTLAFGYYGLFMWFPELFSRIEKFGGTPCDPGPVNTTISNSTVSPSSDTCEAPSNSVFLEGFLTAVSNLPGNLFTIFLMDKLGRKLLLSSSMCISGLAVFFIWFVQTRVQNVAISCVFGAVSTIGWNALDVLSTELFPTNVRTTAFGVQTGVARIGAILGNVIFGELVDIHCAIPMIMVAVLLCVGGLTAIKLPNTTGIDIH
ncbi:synaptic vesicle glycoprotein 2C-like [Haliotis cracherodii]|uniref:synaptic vesicle glycoprotein 2C-like n=1 Tax=Haliotis cracherodii TaxID=6455 RepID=UPI0039EC7569